MARSFFGEFRSDEVVAAAYPTIKFDGWERGEVGEAGELAEQFAKFFFERFAGERFGQKGEGAGRDGEAAE